MSGELDSAEGTLRAILPITEAQEKIAALMDIVSLCYFEGKLQAARDMCRDAIGFCRKVDRPSDEAYFHYLLGELSAESSRQSTYSLEMKESERLCGSPLFELPLIAASYAQNGRPNESRRLLSRIASAVSSDPYFLKRRDDYIHLVRGEILLKSGPPVQAVREFQSVRRVHGGDPIFLLAQSGIARSADIQHDTIAAGLYMNLLERKGETVMACVRSIRTSGFWIRQLWPDAEFALGKLLFRNNDRANAGQHLRRCLRYWSRADGEDRRSREAATLLAQITKSP